MTLIILARV